MLLMITQGSMWKALLDVLQGKRTVLKASYCHSERHSQGPAFACKRQSRGGRSMSHTPRLRTANQSGAAHQPYGDTGRHMFHGSARGAEHCALWDTLLHPQLPLPLETRTGSYTHPCEHGQRRRGKQHGRQPRVCHPARRAAAPWEQGTLQAWLSLCLPALRRGALLRSERLCRATEFPDTDPECTQKQWQLGPKMSTWI